MQSGCRRGRHPPPVPEKRARPPRGRVRQREL